MTSKMNTNRRLVRCPKCRNVLEEPPEVLVYECGGCYLKLEAKKRKNTAIDTKSQKLEDYSSGKQKIEKVSDDQEAGSSSNQQSLINSIDRNSDLNDLQSSIEDQNATKKGENGNKIDEPVRNSDRNDPRSSTELSGHEDPESSPEATTHNRKDKDHDQAAVIKQENAIVDAKSIEIEYSSNKQKAEQLSDDHENNSGLNQRLWMNSINEQDQKIYHNDPESSPESTVRNKIDQDHNDDLDQEFLSCRKGDGFEESGSEFEETIANQKIVRAFDGSSKSSFKSLIAEKLLDTRQKKVAYLDDNDDVLSEDGSADLRHRQRFNRVSSVETSENARFGGTSYYGYDGSVSSFDGNDDQIVGKNRIGLKGDEHIYRSKRRNDFHPSNRDNRSFYGSNEFHDNPRNRSIPKNPKIEKIELLKMVRELQDQLERTNVSNDAYYNHVHNHQAKYGHHRMAFSGEAPAMNRRRNDNSCHQCYPQDRHFSAQLPRQHVYRPRYSGPLSPKHVSESEFSAPDDYRNRNDVTKPHRSPKKRYVRPISSGSPWIACYRCSELLQLPQSFLVFKKRCHRLRCGSCLKILTFTLSNRTHVSRYYPEETIAAPPSSEVEDYGKSNAVSCSDRSFQKSCSTETDRYGSREFSDERRQVAMSRHVSDSTGPSSSKVLGQRITRSEIEEVETATYGSPLHWLMGYASPSKVIRG